MCVCKGEKRSKICNYVKIIKLGLETLSILKLKLNYDRQSVGQSVLVSGTRDQSFFLLEIFFRQFSCGFVIL
jgi:hypothetical protein